MRKNFVTLLVAIFMISGCVSNRIPKDALLLSPESLSNRQMQTRKFETTDYSAMLSAATAVYQDLGFSVDEAEVSLGVIVGSKARDATSGGQVAGAVVIALLTGASTPIDATQFIRVSLVVREQASLADPKVSDPASLSAEKIGQIKARVTQAVSDGLKTTFPEDVSIQVAEKIGGDTAKILTNDLTRLMKVKSSGGSSTVRVTFQRIIVDTRGQVTKREQITDPEIYKDFFNKLSQAVFLEAHEI